MKYAHGFRELDRAFAKLGGAITEQAKVRAAMAGGTVLRDEARRLAPERSGALRRSISVVEPGGVTLQGAALPADITVIIGPLGGTPDGDVPWAYETEYGQFYWAGQPYMRPAEAAKGAEAVTAVRTSLLDTVKAALR